MRPRRRHCGSVEQRGLLYGYVGQEGLLPSNQRTLDSIDIGDAFSVPETSSWETTPSVIMEKARRSEGVG